MFRWLGGCTFVEIVISILVVVVVRRRGCRRIKETRNKFLRVGKNFVICLLLNINVEAIKNVLGRRRDGNRRFHLSRSSSSTILSRLCCKKASEATDLGLVKITINCSLAISFLDSTAKAIRFRASFLVSAADAKPSSET
jgi:hypothetical protein